jgi:hypothetical protein
MFFYFIFPVFETLTDNENEYNCSLMDAAAQQKIPANLLPETFHISVFEVSRNCDQYFGN